MYGWALHVSCLACLAGPLCAPSPNTRVYFMMIQKREQKQELVIRLPFSLVSFIRNWNCFFEVKTRNLKTKLQVACSASANGDWCLTVNFAIWAWRNLRLYFLKYWPWRTQDHWHLAQTILPAAYCSTGTLQEPLFSQEPSHPGPVKGAIAHTMMRLSEYSSPTPISVLALIDTCHRTRTAAGVVCGQ